MSANCIKQHGWPLNHIQKDVEDMDLECHTCYVFKFIIFKYIIIYTEVFVWLINKFYYFSLSFKIIMTVVLNIIDDCGLCENA